MHALEEIRKKESEIELRFRPVNEMYALLDQHLSDVLDKDESENNTLLKKEWEKLIEQAENVRNDLQGQQAEFKKTLIQGINYLIGDVEELRKNFIKYGPMAPGI